MSFVHLALLPSALLAWPVYNRWAGSTGFDHSMMNSIESCASLAVAIIALLAMHRSARVWIARDQEQPSWLIRCLANRSMMERAWIVLQPLLLTFACWPGLTASVSIFKSSLTGQSLSLLLPSLLFLGCLHGWRRRSLWMTFTPILLMTSMAILCDAVRWMMSLSELHQDLWSLTTVSTTTLWSTVAIVLVASMLSSMLLPNWIVWCIGAEPIEDSTSDHSANNEIAQRILKLWSEIHPACPSVHLWPTNCRMSNAVIVVGLFRRKLLLTDRLLLRFTHSEIELIVLHELSHCLGHHGLVRMLPTLLTIPLLAWAMTSLTGTVLVATCISLAVAFPIALVASCWWTEWDADRRAIRLAIKHCGLSRAEAIDQYIEVIQKLYRDNRIQRSSWTHPSCQQRLAAFQNGL